MMRLQIDMVPLLFSIHSSSAVFSAYVCVCVLGFLFCDGEFNQENRQFINPKEGARITLTGRTWF